MTKRIRLLVMERKSRRVRVKSHAQNSFPRLSVKKAPCDCSKLFISVSIRITEAPQQCYITSSSPAEIYLSIPEREASIILNNRTQIALWEVRRAAGRKASLQALALLSVERYWSFPRGVPFLPFLLFWAFLLFFVWKIDHMVLLTALCLPIFNVMNRKLKNFHCLLGDEVYNFAFYKWRTEKKIRVRRIDNSRRMSGTFRRELESG